jgi:hypothetical protein
MLFRLSRNKILDLSDRTEGSQLMALNKKEKEHILNNHHPNPTTEEDADFKSITKHLRVSIFVVK